MKSFVLAADNFVWTKKGLFKISELTEGVSILGVLRGDLHWYELSSKPMIKKNYAVYHLIGNRNEVFLPKGEEIITKRAIKKISEITASDLIEFCPYLTPEILRDVEAIHLNQDLACLLGMLTRRVSLSLDKIAIKTVSENETVLGHIGWRAIQIIQKHLNLIDFDYETETGPLYSFIVFEKNKEISKFIKDFESLPGKVPPVIRKSEPRIMKAFLEGFLEVAINLQEFTLRAFPHEEELRRFILNYLSLYHLPVKVSVSMFSNPHYVDFTLPKETVDFFILRSIKKLASIEPRVPSMKRKMGFRFPYSRILSCYLERKTISCFPEEIMNWKPLVELIPMLPHGSENT